MEEINTELLISLIEERPAIWDKTLNIYKDKNIKESAWREICVILKEGFEEKEQKERQEFGKLVLKKWTHIRDSWSKSIKRYKEQKQSGSSTKSSKLYVFHEQMSFLNKIIDTTVAHESTDNNKNEENKSDDANDEAKNQDEIVEDAKRPRSIPESVSKKNHYENPAYYNQPQINTVPLPMMNPRVEPVKSPAALSTISTTSQASDCSLIDLDLQNF
ncbi:uncharacterized protein [Mycetomoellerius zeteki]|uniref:uncharacterized protein n=1 Tax=Mycetomoellerius zeteki TaxID=64791 RepID=UPI00084E50C7|nr:PREDICTED: uncharacterized protein LOC108727818 [Trachymyrmex zeteki]